MKLIPHIKKGLKLIAKDCVMMVVSFLILPMSMAIVYGSMQKNSFNNQGYKINPISVNFQYNDETERGNAFKSILSQKDVQSFIHVEDSKPEYSVIISNDFKSAEIKGKDQGSVEFLMLKNFLSTVLNNFNKYEAMDSSINSLKLDETEKQTLTREALGILEKNKGVPPIKEEIVMGYKTLGSLEYFTISMFSFTSMILIVALAGFYFKEVREGIVKRSLSTPNNRRDYFLGFILSSFIVSIAISSIYVLINRLRGVAFTGSVPDLMLIIFLQGLLCASAVGAVISFIKRDATANAVMSLLIIVPSIFGGSFFYSEVIGSGIIKTLINSVPNALILNSYKSLAITGSLNGARGELTAMAVLSLILLTLSLIKIHLKWEV